MWKSGGSDTPKVVWRSGSALLSWSAGLGSIPGAKILLWKIIFPDRDSELDSDEISEDEDDYER